MGKMYVTWRPLPEWPHASTSGNRRSGNFKVSLERTIRELLDEVLRIQIKGNSDEVVIGAGYGEGDIRQDGTPRARAYVRHPGVEVSFDSKHGRLTYASDVFIDWQDNVRAVRLALEALRAIDRYGVAKRGQQYAGFALLTAGPGKEELGRRHVERWGSVKEALRHTHPDTGDTDMTQHDYEAVIAFRDAERAAGRA